MSEIALAGAAALPLPQGGALPTSLEWQALERMATMLADSSLVPYRLRGKPGDIAVILLAAREYGVPPLMALSKLPVVNGTPAPMGELMVALILRAGHKIAAKVYNADGTEYAGTDPITEGTYAECTSRRLGDDEDDVLRFTVAEAITAQLVELRDGKPWARVVKTKNGRDVEEVTPWELYTVNMLRWRAVANTARLRFPDVLLGLSYLPEELGAMVDAEGAPVIVDGELVTVHDRRGPSQPAPPAPSIESRTAAEFLEQALRIGEADKLANGRAWAERNGILGEPVDVDDDHRLSLNLGEDEVTLGDVLAALVDYLGEGNGALVMDAADVAPDAPADSAAQEAPATPPAGEQAQPQAQAPTEEPSPQTAAQGPDVASPEEVADAIRRTVPRALESADVDVIRRTYSAAGAGGRTVNVADLLTEDDRERLGVDAEVTEVAYGALLMAIGSYLDRHGRAVRAPLDELPVEDPPGGEWADTATATPSPLEHG